MPKNAIRFMCLVAAVVFPGLPGASAGDKLTAKVDRIFSSFDRPDSPGCALGVIQDGRFVYQRGYGSANLDYNIPLSTQSVFYVASTSKQFTAASVALLAGQKKVSLDDDIRRYLPELRDYGSSISIRHLLHHTSGLRDYLTLTLLAGMRIEDIHPRAEILGLIARQQELNFRPGDDFLYSNTGYLLLGEIVRRASGRTLRDYAHELIFKPLAMDSTHFHDDRELVVRNRANGYYPREGGGFRTQVSNFELVGDGGLHTTVEDLARWDRNFYQPKVGDSEFLRLIQTPGQLNDGRQIEYAYGLRVNRYKGRKMVSHGGSLSGFRTEFLRFPELRLSVICLCNLSSANAAGYARQVADLYLEDRFREGVPVAVSDPADPARPIELAGERLQEKAGRYWNHQSGEIWTLTVKDNGLWVESENQKFRLEPVNSTEFRSVGAAVETSIRFSSRGTPPAPMLEADTGNGRPGIYESFAEAKPSPVLLSEYAGEYYSEELDSTYRFSVVQDGLVLSTKASDDRILQPLIRDFFRTRGLIVGFQRNAAGRIEHMALNAGRVRNIRFVRRRSGEAAGN